MPQTRAILSVKHTIERVRDQADDYLNKNYPGDHPGPKKWLGLVCGLLDTADKNLEEAQDQGKTFDQVRALTQNAAGACALAYRCMLVFRGATIDELPYPVVTPLQRWLDDLCVTNDTFFRAELISYYELRKFTPAVFDGVHDKSQTFIDAIAEIEWPVFRITVPSKAFGILPHFAIVAHEIGHAVFEKMSWDLPSLQPNQPPFVRAVLSRLGNPVDKEDVVREKIVAIFMSWFEELVADCVAFYLTGPAAFFSLGEFLGLLGGGLGISAIHPGNHLRRKILFSKLFRTICTVC